MIQNARIKHLNEKEVVQGDFVLYWMQSSQREEYNHALEYSIEKANKLKVPVVVLFVLDDEFPESNLRHFKFMLEGLKETGEDLEERNVKFVVRRGKPQKEVQKLASEASMVVADRAYLKFLRDWRDEITESISCSMVQVESDIVIPVEEASKEEEYAARTLRPKIDEKLEKYMKPLERREVKRSSLEFDFDSFNIREIDKALKALNLNDDVSPSEEFQGGSTKAKEMLEFFVKNKLDDYAELSNDPTKNFTSNLSPYIHFGQISPLQIALRVQNSDRLNKKEFLEQLIVRKELAINFVYYNENYDSLKSTSDWAYESLKEPEGDKREYVYSFEEFEKAGTHDEYWNAAQREMLTTGKMHNYMRMYWGKKILEWSDTLEKAFEIALKLNNKYELDGRDPNGYTGVAWLFGKHDNAFKEREVFGKVRYMNKEGLDRKFDMEKYVKRYKDEN